MYKHVRITSDRRGEMSIIFECKSVVAKVFHIISGLCHCPEGKQFYGIVFRSILCCSKERVEFLGYILTGVCRSHPVTEVTYEVPEGLDLVLIRFVMDSVNEGPYRLTAL